MLTRLLYEDINQVKLYRRKLKSFGFEVLGYEISKGMPLEELMEQVYSSEIDLLMIDFRLKEGNILAFNGDEVEREIYEKKPLFPLPTKVPFASVDSTAKGHFSFPA